MKEETGAILPRGDFRHWACLLLNHFKSPLDAGVCFEASCDGVLIDRGLGGDLAMDAGEASARVIGRSTMVRSSDF